MAAGGRDVRWRVWLRRGVEEWWSNLARHSEEAAGFDTPHLILNISVDGSLRFLGELDPPRERVASRDANVAEMFSRVIGDFFDRFDGAAFFSDDVFVVYDHPCT